MEKTIYDVAVIGGGINGVGIALDLQGRGLKVLLLEKKDLASATSSASSKLIHGGLRYLEHYEFNLVRQALNEREILLAKAPHLVKPLRFILPHRKHLRPAWLIRMGLFLYDFLGKRDILPKSRFLRFTPQTSALKPDIHKGFEYSDCWVDDARLVALNAIQCQELGGDIRTYTQCTHAHCEDGIWHIGSQDMRNGSTQNFLARGLVNAAGPWVEALFAQALNQPSPHQIKLIRGSHIVVPRLNQDERAYILQNSDGRIVFVLPYLNRFSLVGTTDALHTGSPDAVAVTPEEIDYLCATVNDYFVKQISPADIIWRYSGVRPLCDDESTSPQALTRDYTLDIHTVNGAPLLSVFGGKLTTYRKLSEKATAALEAFYPQMTPGWTKTSVVPGGDMGMPIADYIQQLQQQFPFLSASTVERLATSYGTRALLFLRAAKALAELGQDFGEQFTAAEVDYLIAHEFVRTGEDALWRRTKMGIFLSEAQRRQVADYIESRQPASIGNNI